MCGGKARTRSSSGVVDRCHGIVQQPFAGGAQEGVADASGNVQRVIGCRGITSHERLAPLPEELGLGP